jgi:hypothetical protein
MPTWLMIPTAALAARLKILQALVMGHVLVSTIVGAAGYQLVKAAHRCEHAAREFERFCLETVSVATC